MPFSSVLHCGPSGWSHPHWNAVVYPDPKPKGFHGLDYLAQRFDTVEISSSFSEPLKPELTRLWARKVEANPAFRFTVKLARRFTHERVLDAAEVKAFEEGLMPLAKAGKLGCVLMQFPWSFRFTKENRDFLIQLRRTFHKFPLAAEMRHVSWSMDEAIGTMIDYHIAFCNIDQPSYTKAMPPTSFLTSSIGYVRLHGRNCFNWYQDNYDPATSHRYDYLYSEEELLAWKKRIDNIRSCAEHTYVVFNNDSRGKSVTNALQMQQLLGMRSMEPVNLKDLKRPAQTSLFTEYRKAVA